MQFETPSTKAEMYATLKLIYNEYRLHSPVYKEEALIDMTIPTLPVPNKTKAQCDEEATLSLSSEHTREIERAKAELEDKISVINTLVKELELEKSEKLEEIQLEYDKRLENLENHALEKGISTSSILVTERNKIVSERAEKTKEIEMYYELEVMRKNAEIVVLEARLGNVESYYSPIHRKEINALSAKLYKEYQTQKL